MSILIAIPCFNEKDNISNTIHKIQESTKSINVEILVVEDGSTDNTIEVLNKLSDTIIQHEVNKGLGEAFRSMMNYCLEKKHDYMITIDADGQFDSMEIGKFINEISSKKFDFVTGSRFLSDSQTENMPKARKVGNKIYARVISKLAAKEISDVSCGFRAYTRNALLHLNLSGQFTYTHETILSLAQQKLRFSELPIKVKYFEERESAISGNLFKYAINTSRIIFRNVFYFAPSRVFFWLGNVFLLPSFIFLSLFFEHKIDSGSFQGYYFAGVLGGLFGALSFVMYTAAAISIVMTRILKEQNKILFLTKLNLYKGGNS
jgi:glycosyltransferase involved in cell wall biosynthesis